MGPYFQNVDDDTFYKQIYKDYGKTKDDLEEYLDILTKWVETQKHFPEVPARQALRSGLLTSKCSIERTKEKIDMYYTMRSIMPEMFSGHPLSPQFVFLTKVLYTIPLPKHTSNLERVIYIHMNPEYGPEYFDHESFSVNFIQIIELIIQEDKCYNFHIVFDCIGAKLGHTTKFSPMVIKKMSLLLQKMFANRVATIYVVNFYSFLENVINTMFMPFLPQKITKKVRIHNSSSILLDVFGKDIMPKDIGGEEKSLEELRENLFKKFEEWKPRYDKLQNMKIDETLRPEKLENDEILGYYGNFRKIGVD